MHVWKEQLTDRIFVLDEAQEKEWFLGKNIELDDDQGLGAGFVSVKAGEDFVGMGKIGVDGDMLYGFLPKERRRRN
jgi:NOL1/NOP2/fmu family ribosome biogenesis protein